MNHLPEKSQTVMLESLTPQNQATTILDILTRAILLTGTCPQEDDLAIIVSEVINLVNTRYQNLTIGEIAETIRKGVLGDFQESYLSVRNINIWLKGFQLEKARKKSLMDKKRDGENQMPMAIRGAFFFKNIDKIPSLRKLLNDK